MYVKTVIFYTAVFFISKASPSRNIHNDSNNQGEHAMNAAYNVQDRFSKLVAPVNNRNLQQRYLLQRKQESKIDSDQSLKKQVHNLPLQFQQPLNINRRNNLVLSKESISYMNQEKLHRNFSQLSPQLKKLPMDEKKYIDNLQSHLFSKISNTPVPSLNPEKILTDSNIRHAQTNKQASTTSLSKKTASTAPNIGRNHQEIKNVLFIPNQGTKQQELTTIKPQSNFRKPIQNARYTLIRKNGDVEYYNNLEIIIRKYPHIALSKNIRPLIQPKLKHSTAPIPQKLIAPSKFSTIFNNENKNTEIISFTLPTATAVKQIQKEKQGEQQNFEKMKNSEAINKTLSSTTFVVQLTKEKQAAQQNLEKNIKSEITSSTLPTTTVVAQTTKEIQTVQLNLGKYKKSENTSTILPSTTVVAQSLKEKQAVQQNLGKNMISEITSTTLPTSSIVKQTTKEKQAVQQNLGKNISSEITSLTSSTATVVAQTTKEKKAVQQSLGKNQNAEITRTTLPTTIIVKQTTKETQPVLKVNTSEVNENTRDDLLSNKKSKIDPSANTERNHSIINLSKFIKNSNISDGVISEQNEIKILNKEFVQKATINNNGQVSKKNNFNKTLVVNVDQKHKYSENNFNVKDTKSISNKSQIDNTLPSEIINNSRSNKANFSNPLPTLVDQVYVNQENTTKLENNNKTEKVRKDNLMDDKKDYDEDYTSVSKPVLWFSTTDPEFWKKIVNEDDAYSFVYIINVETKPKIEKERKTTIHANGTVVEELIESVWENNDNEPKVTKTVKVIPTAVND